MDSGAVLLWMDRVDSMLPGEKRSSERASGNDESRNDVPGVARKLASSLSWLGMGQHGGREYGIGGGIRPAVALVHAHAGA